MTLIAEISTQLCAACKQRPQAWPDSGNNYCTECQADYVKGWRTRNPESYRLSGRKNNLKRRFNMTIEQYDALLEEQGGVCKSCGEPPKDKRLAVDHDHSCCPGRDSCGECVRALLCARCNLWVGMIEQGKLDDVLRYLEVSGRG